MQSKLVDTCNELYIKINWTVWTDSYCLNFYVIVSLPFYTQCSQVKSLEGSQDNPKVQISKQLERAA